MTLHPELLGLLNGCRHAPADDTPRLVLADWLEEHADASGLPSAADALARAELLRVQVELARPTLDTARTVQLRAAEARLLAERGPDWLGDLPRLFDDARRVRGSAPATNFQPQASWNPWRFSRGLLTAELAQGELANAKLCAWFGTPLGAWVEAVMLDVSGLSVLAELHVPDALRPVLGLRLSLGTTQYGEGHRAARPEQVKGPKVRRLFRGDTFGLVRDLTLHEPALTDAALDTLVRANVSGLRRLKVSGTLGRERAERLAAVPMGNLFGLDISGCGVGAPGFVSLVRSPHLARLVWLAAYRNAFGDEGAAALAESPLAEGLRHVELQNCGIGDRGGVALVRSPLLARLYGPGLNLSLNPLGNGTAKALAASPHAANFTELVLRDCRIGDPGAKALAASPHLARLTYLDLWSNRIGDGGARALAESDALPNVRDLNLRDNRVTAKGAAALRDKYGDRAKV